jgi:ATP-dependent DNA helicase RecG
LDIEEITVEKTDQKTVEKTVEKILNLLDANPGISQKELAELTGLSQRGVEWNIKKLKDERRLHRIGGRKEGHWEVI